ncbi:MAG: FtsX-like permease family protein [Nitrospiraceae bacterium]|nr:FtsX-like permease family protein [Nitrospiraceae bacterium]
MTLTTLLRRISLKHIRHQKMRTAMALFGVALGVAAMTSIDIVNSSVIRSLEDSINRITGRAVLQITGAESGFPEEMLEKVQKVPGVEYAVPVIETNASLATGSERSFVVLGVDVLQDSNMRDYSVTGDSSDIPDPLLFLAKPDSILLTREMAQREGISIDQKIEVQTVQGLKTFTVRGLLEPDGPAKALGGDIALMDIYAAQLAFGKNARIDRIDVSVLRGETLDSVKTRIQAALPSGYNIDTPAGRSRQIENLMGRFRKSMDVISFMALFVGMYLIYNTVSISVVQRKKEIGILRAIGATRGQIIGLFLAETVALSLIASFLGVALGWVLAKLSINAVAQTVSSMYGRSSVTGLDLSLASVLRNIATGIVASLAAAAFPAYSSTHVAPVSAIRSLAYTSNGTVLRRLQKILALSFILLAGIIIAVYKTVGVASPLRNSSMTTLAMFSLTLGVSLAAPLFLKWFIRAYRAVLAPRLGAGGRLAGLNLEKNLTRNAVAVAAVFFSISLSVSSSSMMNSARRGVMDYIDSVDNSDILITSGHPLASAGAPTIPMPLSMRQELESIPGVRSVDPFRKLFINIDGRRVLLEMIDVVTWPRNNTCTIIEGAMQDIPLIRGKDEVTVNENVAMRMGLKKGSTLVLPTPSGPRPFRVAAVIVSYASDSGVIFMDMPTYEKYWNDHVSDMFSIYVEKGRDIAAVRTAIQKRYQGTRKMFVLAALEFRQEIKKMLDRSVVMNDAVNVLTLLIAGFGIIVTLLASVLERTREIGILRSIGMQRRQVSGVVLIESALIGAAGGLLGICAGVITGWINLEGFFRIDFGPSMAYHIHYPSIATALLFAVGLSILAGLYPARRAAKTNITEALAYE